MRAPSSPALQVVGPVFPLKFGRFVLLETLGEGGMGAVFRAHLEGDGGFRKPCAVKVMHPSILVAARRMAVDLRVEARLGALLHHPHVVEIYDYGIEKGQPWISMELVDGTELSDLIKGAGSLPSSVVLELGIQLCSALDHAHSLVYEGRDAEFVHRDLKPSNVIVSREGLAKITDFGIAKAAIITGLTTRSGVTKGTPSFMSPEQATGGDVDGRSDLFSLATILYQAATGRRLFKASNAAATVMEVLGVDELMADESVLGRLEDAVPGMGAVLQRALRRDPTERFDSAADMREALQLLELDSPPGPTLRRWLADLPGRGTGYRGIRMRRRRFAQAAGPPPFDPARDLASASPPEPPVDSSSDSDISGLALSSSLDEVQLDTWAVEEREMLVPVPPRWWSLAALAAAVLAGLALGLLLAPGGPSAPAVTTEPAPERADPAPIASVQEAPLRTVLLGTRTSVDEVVIVSEEPAEVPVEVAPALPPAPSILHAGAADVGEPGEAAAARTEDSIGDEDGDSPWREVGSQSASLHLFHPKPVRRAEVGQRPSFILRAEGPVEGATMYLRYGSGTWEPHPLSRFGEELWGTKIYVTADMLQGVDYYFEARHVEGDSERLRDRVHPYRMAVDPLVLTTDSSNTAGL